MAIVVTTIDSGQADTGGGSTFNTASLGSGTGVTRLVSIRTYGATGITSITGDGLTYSQIATAQSPADSGLDSWLWVGTGNPTAGALTVTLAGGTGLFYSYVVESVAGADTTSPIVQNVPATGTGTTASATLAAFGSGSNGTYAMVGLASSSTFTPGTGFTELNDFAGIFATYRHFTEWRADADTSPDATISASADWEMIAIEIAQAGGGGGSSIAAIRRYFSMMRTNNG